MIKYFKMIFLFNKEIENNLMNYKKKLITYKKVIVIYIMIINNINITNNSYMNNKHKHLL